MDTTTSECNPLFSSIYSGSMALVKYLVEAGIDHKVAYTGPSVTNMDALAFAEERGQVEIVEYLKTI